MLALTPAIFRMPGKHASPKATYELKQATVAKTMKQIVHVLVCLGSTAGCVEPFPSSIGNERSRHTLIPFSRTAKQQ